MVHGDELPDWDFHIPSKLVAPALIAADFGLEYITYARQGASNDLIIRRVSEYLLNDYRPGDFVFIGWSSLYRKELYVPALGHSLNFIPNYFTDSNFEHLEDNIIKDIMRVHQYYVDTIETIDLDLLMIDFTEKVNMLYHALENLSLPFIMVRMLSEYKDISQSLIQTLSSHPNFYLGHDSMMQYLSSFNDARSLFNPGRHPNEEGQRRIQSLVMDYMQQ